jgi:hypothetical protein
MTSRLSFSDNEVSEICRLIRSAFCPKDEQLAPVLSGVRAVSSRSTIRPSRAAPNGCASCRRPITMTMYALERCSMCVASWIATATPCAKRRSDFGKIRVKCQCEGVLLVGNSVGLSSRGKLRYCRSTNRRRGRSPFGTHSKRYRVLCPQRLNLVGDHQGSGRQTLNLGLLFLANVPYAIDLCAMVWFSSRDYGRGVNRPTYRAAIEEFQR